MRWAPHWAEMSRQGTPHTFSEAVNKKIFQADFRRSRLEPGAAVAQANPKHLMGPEILDRFGIKLNWIIEEATPIENAREPLADQHDGLGGDRIRCTNPDTL